MTGALDSKIEPVAWSDVGYLISIIDMAIEQGFDPDEDADILADIRKSIAEHGSRIPVEAALLAAEQRGREAERGEIVKALEPFVPDYQPWMDDFPNDEKSGLYRVGTFGQIRAARALLTELKETTDNG